LDADGLRLIPYNWHDGRLQSIVSKYQVMLVDKDLAAASEIRFDTSAHFLFANCVVTAL
jgi:hypothetical protein